MRIRSIIILALLTAFTAFGEQKREINRTIPVTAAQRIEMSGFDGSDIHYKAWDKNEISVHVTVSIELSDPQEEQRAVESLDLTVEQSAATVSVKLSSGLEQHESGGWGFFRWLGRLFRSSYRRQTIGGEISVPRSNELSCRSSFGTFDLEGMKGAVDLSGSSNTVTLADCSNLRRIRNDFGPTTIRQSGGVLDFSGNSSTVTIEDFDGTVKISSSFSTITLTRLAKSATVHSNSGKVNAQDVKGDLDVDAPFTTINATDIAGFVTAKTNSGKVIVRNADGASVDGPFSHVEVYGLRGIKAKELVFENNSGSILLDDVKANCTLRTQFTKVELKNVRGNIDLDNNSGSVRAYDIKGNWRSDTRFTSVSIDKLTADEVFIRNSSNSIALDLAASPKSLEVRNEFGNISIMAPADVAGDVTIETEFGSIETNLPLKVKNLSGGGYATGKIGTVERTIQVEAKSGNVKFLKR